MMSFWTIYAICGLMWTLAFSVEEQSSNKIQGCITANQAKRLNEEITRMLEATPYVELITTFTNNLESLVIDRVDKCFEDYKLLFEISKMALEQNGQDGSAAMKQFELFKNNGVTGFKVAYEKLLDPLILSAKQIETLIDEGNKRRLLYLDIISKFRDIWLSLRNLRREQEQALQALHPELKSAFMITSAEIGQYLREGNANNKYSHSSDIVRGFTDLEEGSHAFQLWQDYDKTMGDNTANFIFEKIWMNFIFSQAEIAVRKTDFENKIASQLYGYKPDAVEAMDAFSELRTSKAIKGLATVNRDCLTEGENEAREYVNSVNSTMKKLREGFLKMEYPSTGMNCMSVRRIELGAAQLFLGVFRHMHNLAPNINANGYRNKLYSFHEKSLLPTLTASPLKTPIKIILKMIPLQRTPKIEESYNYLNDYIQGPSYGYDLATLNKTLENVALHVGRLTDAFKCNRKVAQFIGNVVFGCMEGRKSLTDLYNEHVDKSNVNSLHCKELNFLKIPSEDQMKQLITTFSKNKNFNSDCQQNKQNDDPGQIYFDDHFDYLEDEDSIQSSDRLSPTQKFMVCDLRKRSKPISVIAGLISVSERLVGGVRCKNALKNA